MPREEYINIIVLLSKEQYSGKYVFSIDVAQGNKKKVDALIKTRAGEGFELNKCLMNTGRSPIIQIEVASKGEKYHVRFEVSGALKPLREFKQGENLLEFTGKNDCQKIVTLDRNPNDKSSHACIEFFQSERHLHCVTIGEIPCPEGCTRAEAGLEDSLKKASISEGNDAVHIVSDYSAGSDNSGNEAVPLAPRDQTPSTEPPPISLLAAMHVPQPRDDDDDGSAEASSSDSDRDADGAGSANPGNTIPLPENSPVGVPLQTAIPVQPPPDDDGNSPPKASGSCETSDNDRDTDGAGISSRALLLCDKSLNVLANALTPQEANRLIAGLGIPNHTVKQTQTNVRGDVVQQNYELLKEWRNRNTSEGTDKIFDSLLHELDESGRNDLKSKILRVEKENRKLTVKDLQ